MRSHSLVVMKHLLLITMTYANTIQNSSPLYVKTFNLATLSGKTGFNISGVIREGGLGLSVRTAGDINGDGISDLILGAPYVNNYAGAAYAIFGQASGFNSSFDLNTLNGKNGFTIPGVSNFPGLSSSQLGTSVSTAGDINGDGISDLILGAPYVNFDAGATYVIFGQASGFNSSFDLNTLNGKNGFIISGSVNLLGSSVSTAGDINSDGIIDIVLGATFGAGAAYVIFGQFGGFNTSFDLNTLNGNNGFTIPGLSSDSNLGRSVSTAGDINSDGIKDLVLVDNTGAAYVIFGRFSGFNASFNLNTLNGKNGFTITGLSLYSPLISASTAGDINGDGITDLVLGANSVNSYTGIAYVIFGQYSGFNATFNLSTINGKNGFTIPGLYWGNNLGRSVSTAGDINGDGIADLILGGPSVDFTRKSAAYVIYGQFSGFNASFNLNELNGMNGFTIPGLDLSSSLGLSVSTAGDINRDGLTDLILGDEGMNAMAGTAYAIFGFHQYAPLLINNTLTIKQAHSARITSANLSGQDLNGSPETMQFMITNLQGGQFKRYNDSQPVNLFDQQAIMDGNIQFVQDGSSTGVAYQVSVSNDVTATPPSNANVTFIITEPFVYRPFPNQTVEINHLFNWTLSADTFLSPDNQPLTLSLLESNGAALPDWIHFDPNNRQLTGWAISAGINHFSIFAHDPYNLSARTNFTLSVDPDEGLGLLFWIGVGAGLGGFILVGVLLAGYLHYRKTAHQKSDYKEIPDVSRENENVSSTNPQQ